MMSDIMAICKTDALLRVVVGLVLVVSCAFLASLIIISFLRVARFLGGAAKEQKLTRMEVSKLAEEVHLLREKLENSTAGDR